MAMKHCINMILLGFMLAIISKSLSVTNPQKGECFWWSFAESFSVNQEIVSTFNILHQIQSRSFLECCTQCDVSLGCIGVAYRARECNLLNGIATGSLLTGSDQNTDYKVMLYDSTPRTQVNNHFLLFKVWDWGSATNASIYLVHSFIIIGCLMAIFTIFHD